MSTRSRWQVVLLLMLVIAGSMAQAQRGADQPPPTADEGFVPIDELPPDERMPAAPFLIAAYSVAWIVVALYLWSIWQRLGRVEREIADLSRRVQHGSLTVPAPRGGERGPVAPQPRSGEGGPGAPKPGGGEGG